MRTVSALLCALRLEKHPDKTFIGPIARGFDFLVYHFGFGTLTLADATIERLVAQSILLYEQGWMERVKAQRLGRYVRRWRAWAKAGISGLGEDCTETLSSSIDGALGLIPCYGTQAA